MSRAHDLSLLTGRAVLGSYLAAHGAQKLFGAFGGGGLEPVAAAFQRLGLRPGRAMAALAGMCELGGGLLTAAGLADPIGPVALAGTMAVASATHRANGPLATNGGYELALTNMAGALTLAATGAGRYSLDGLIKWHLPLPLRRLLIMGTMGATVINLVRVVRTSPASDSTGTAPLEAQADAVDNAVVETSVA